MSSAEVLVAHETDQPAAELVEYIFLPTDEPLPLNDRACKDTEVEAFFRDENEKAATYKPREKDLVRMYCTQCAVRLACLGGALARGEKYGLYGVPSEDRTKLRQAKAAQGLVVHLPRHVIDALPLPAAQNAIVAALLPPKIVRLTPQQSMQLPKNRLSQVELSAGLLDFLSQQPDGELVRGVASRIAAHFAVSPLKVYPVIADLQLRGVITVEYDNSRPSARPSIHAIRQAKPSSNTDTHS